MVRTTTASAAALAALACPAAAFVPTGQLRATTSTRGEWTAQAPRASVTGYLGSAGLATAAVVAGVAAVVRPRATQSRTERHVVGVSAPVNTKFDPLNLGNTDVNMDRYTAAEIKHGRIAMIATLGYIMPEIFRFPGCEDFKHGLAAFDSIPFDGWVQLFALIGAHEVLVKPRMDGMGIYDFGLGTELLDGPSDWEIERKQTSERNNGRLAMVAIMGMMVQDKLFGITPIQMLATEGFFGPPVNFIVQDIPVCTYIGSVCALPKKHSRITMRASSTGGSTGEFDETRVWNPKTEMSVALPYLKYPQELKGWVGGEKGFDPLGVTDALPVYWVREAELKHSRVCMLATIGWIATDLGARFPGAKFQAVASTVEAHDKMVEAGYMGSFFGAIGTFELYGGYLLWQGFNQEIKREAGDFFVGKQFMPKDPEAQQRIRLKELENGRLAMFAFSGIVTQAIITGKTWPFL